MNKRLIIMFAAVVFSLTMMADTKQTVKIDGTTVDKTVERLTFDGDKVVLTFTDHSTQTEDMELVSIDFFYSGTGISRVKTDEMSGKHIYNLNGQYLGIGLEGRAKGVYVVDGKKVVVK